VQGHALTLATRQFPDGRPHLLVWLRHRRDHLTLRPQPQHRPQLLQVFAGAVDRVREAAAVTGLAKLFQRLLGAAESDPAQALAATQLLAQALALEVAERMATGSRSAASSPLPRGL